MNSMIDKLSLRMSNVEIFSPPNSFRTIRNPHTHTFFANGNWRCFFKNNWFSTESSPFYFTDLFHDSICSIYGQTNTWKTPHIPLSYKVRRLSEMIIYRNVVLITASFSSCHICIRCCVVCVLFWLRRMLLSFAIAISSLDCKWWTDTVHWGAISMYMCARAHAPALIYDLTLNRMGHYTPFARLINSLAFSVDILLLLLLLETTRLAKSQCVVFCLVCVRVFL